MTEHQTVGRSAVERALGLARQNAATAAIALTLIPLTALPSHAAGSSVTITATPGGTPGDYTIAYTVTNTSQGNPIASAFGGVSIIEIELPELHLGDLDFAPDGSGSVGGVFGWTATETTTQDLIGSGLYSGTPGGYIDLATSGYSANPIDPGESLTFTANVQTNLTVNAAFDVGFSDSSTVAVDPIIPKTNALTAVPEPSSFAALAAAMLGLLWLRCRRIWRPLDYR
jgi:hypothetical protein